MRTASTAPSIDVSLCNKHLKDGYWPNIHVNAHLYYLWLLNESILSLRRFSVITTCSGKL